MAVPGKGNGTVRWIGTLPGRESVRLGVELDTPNEHCHSGHYESTRVFECEPNCGIFIKQSKVKDEWTLMDAAITKYCPSIVAQPSQPASTTKGFPDPILVGQSKAEAHYATNLYTLEELSLDGCGIDTVANLDELKNFQDNVIEISLRDNLFFDFGEILYLCHSWPRLHKVDVSGNRFDDCSPGFEGHRLQSLVMNNCHIPSEVLERIGILFPSLHELSLDGMDKPVDALGPLSYELRHLSLRNLNIDGWTQLLASMDDCLNCPLESLDVGENPFLGDECDSALSYNMRSLKHLNVARCGIEQWSTLTWMAQEMPWLESIRVTENSFYSDPCMKLSAGRHLLVALFPKLVLLNGASVTPANRVESERYCASLLMRKNSPLVHEVIAQFRKTELLMVYGRSSEMEPGGSLGGPDGTAKTSNLIKLTLMGQMYGDLPIRVPRNCKVSELATIVSRKIDWPMTLSQMGLSVASYVRGEQQSLVGHESSEITDFGVDNGWLVYTFVKE